MVGRSLEGLAECGGGKLSGSLLLTDELAAGVVRVGLMGGGMLTRMRGKGEPRWMALWWRRRSETRDVGISPGGC